MNENYKKRKLKQSFKDIPNKGSERFVPIEEVVNDPIENNVEEEVQNPKKKPFSIISRIISTLKSKIL